MRSAVGPSRRRGVNVWLVRTRREGASAEARSKASADATLMRQIRGPSRSPLKCPVATRWRICLWLTRQYSASSRTVT